METKQIIETAEEKLIHTYNRYQIVLDKGDGVRYTIQTKRNILILVRVSLYLHLDITIKNITMRLRHR